MKAFLAALFLAVLPVPSPAAPAPHAEHIVHIKDFKYAPTQLRVHTGDRVTFVNDDDEAHTVSATAKSFDSGGLDAKDRWMHVFTKPGTFAYFCQLHPYMKATIVGATSRHCTW